MNSPTLADCLAVGGMKQNKELTNQLTTYLESILPSESIGRIDHFTHHRDMDAKLNSTFATPSEVKDLPFVRVEPRYDMMSSVCDVISSRTESTFCGVSCSPVLAQHLSHYSSGDYRVYNQRRNSKL